MLEYPVDLKHLPLLRAGSKNGKFIYFDQSWQALINGNPLGWIALLHPEDHHVVQLIKDHLRAQTPFNVHYRLIVNNATRYYWEQGFLHETSESSAEYLCLAADVTLFVHQIQRLEDNECCYHELFERSQVIKLLIDPDEGTILNANPKACSFYGYSREELFGKKINEINIMDPDKIRQEMERALIGNKDCFNFLHQLADGSLREVEVFSGPIRLKDKAILYSIVHDVTTHNAQKRKLTELQGRLERAQEIANAGNWEWEIGSGLVWISKQTCEIFGLKQEAGYVAYHLLELYIHPADKPKRDFEFRQFTEQNIPEYQLKYRIFNPVKEEVRIVFSRGLMEKDPNGKPLRILGVIQDITEQEKLKQKIEHKEKYLGSVIEGTSELFMALDRKDRVKIINTAALEFLRSNFQLELRENDPISKVLPLKYYRYWQKVKKRLEKEHSFHFEEKIPAKSGALLMVDVQCNLLQEPYHHQTYLIFARDTTDKFKAGQLAKKLNREKSRLKLSEQKLIAHNMIIAQENERKRISQELHDSVGQMLSALKMHVSHLLIQQQNNQHEHTEHLLKDLQQLVSETIAGVKEISQNLMPKILQDLGLVPAIKQLVENVQSKTSASFHLHLEPLSAPISEERTIAVYRICQELLNNALKHSGAKNIYIQLLNHPQNMQLIFEDDGIGFDKAAFAYGNGWNNIVQRVEILKANLELDPVPGKGTHVYIKIPY